MTSTTHEVEEPAVTIVHASKASFPTIELGAEYRSKGYITRTLFVDGNIKFTIEDAVVQPVSSARNSKYGIEFITISLPNNFINYLIQSTESQFYRPITKAGSTWFNVQIVDDFGGFRTILGGSEIKVPMDVFRPRDGVGLVTRMLFNAFTSRPENGGPSYIRFRLHDAEIMTSVDVNLPSLPVRGVKTPSRLPARKRSASEDLSKVSSSQTTGGQSRQGEDYEIRTSASVNLSSLSVRGGNTPSRLPGNNRSTSEDLSKVSSSQTIVAQSRQDGDEVVTSVGDNLPSLSVRGVNTPRLLGNSGSTSEDLSKVSSSQTAVSQRRQDEDEIVTSVGVNLPSLFVQGVNTPSRLPGNDKSTSEDLSKVSSSQTIVAQSRQDEDEVVTSVSVNLPSLSVQRANTPSRLPGNNGSTSEDLSKVNGSTSEDLSKVSSSQTVVAQSRQDKDEVMTSVGVNLPSLSVQGVNTPSRLPGNNGSTSGNLSKVSSSQTVVAQSRQDKDEVVASVGDNLPSLSVRRVNAPSRLPGNNGSTSEDLSKVSSSQTIVSQRRQDEDEIVTSMGDNLPSFSVREVNTPPVPGNNRSTSEDLSKVSLSQTIVAQSRRDEDDEDEESVCCMAAIGGCFRIKIYR